MTEHTPDPLAIFRAGRVRRWHTNPDLADTDDRIDGHSARLARIILALHPEPSLGLIAAALTHDDGEHAVGDIPATVKDREPIFSDLASDIEGEVVRRMWGERVPRGLDEDDASWLVFADRLDAFMWAAHHRPSALVADGWPDARRWLFRIAECHGVIDRVEPVLRMAGHR